jgi:hypothetical protein
VGKWLTLVYKVPREPSASRVYVWRKLKQLGAVALQDAVWVLPATPRTKEQFQWLAAEIVELKGEVSFWSSELLYCDDESSLVRQFTEPIDAGYKEILVALRHAHPDVTSLSQRYQQLQRQDYFQASLGPKVREALLSAKGGKKR